MLSFLQLNLVHVISLITLLVVWVVVISIAPKTAFKPITLVIAIICCGVIASLGFKTLYNQVPKREIPRHYVDNGVQKFQERVLNNADKQ